jgi:hypothetical protein
MDLITEFFFEIRRLIPGFAVIALYYHREVINELHVHQDFPVVVLLAFALTIAWLVGLIIEEIMYCVVHIASMLGGWVLVVWSQEWLKVKRQDNVEDIPVERTDKSRDRILRLSQLQFAERVICRSLFGIFLFTLILPPESFKYFPWDSSLDLIPVFAFFFGWLWPLVQNRVKTYNEVPVSSRKSDAEPEKPLPAQAETSSKLTV